MPPARFDSQLASLDAGEGSPLHVPLLMDGLRETRTALEGDFGEWVGDVYYLEELRRRRPSERVFVCAPGG